MDGKGPGNNSSSQAHLDARGKLYAAAKVVVVLVLQQGDACLVVPAGVVLIPWISARNASRGEWNWQRRGWDGCYRLKELCS